MCKVSVIIATYNTAAYLKECLDSIFRQTLKEIEVILVDDGSTDDTASIIQQYQQRYDNLVSIYQENKGAGKARNYGITLAHGEYVIFMDPDDMYPYDDCLERLYKAAQQYHVLICGGTVLSNDNGFRGVCYQAGEGDIACTKNGVVDVRNYYFLYGHTRYLFNTCLIKENQIEYADYSNYEDQVFIIKALGIAGRFYELDYPVYEYRINYKQIKDNVDICYDIWRGIRDTLKLVIQYDLHLMFEKNYQKIMEGYTLHYIDYLFCGSVRIDKVLQEIKDLVEESGWENEEYYITGQKVEEYRKCIKVIKDKLNRILTDGRPIIIYGAGQNTRKLLSKYRLQLQNVVGIAVSSENENKEELEGYIVKNIDQYASYQEEAGVFIAPSEKYKSEILAVLKKKGFKNCEWIDVRMIG